MDARDVMASARRITVVTGAGVSTESGIPDFRGPQWRAEFDLAAYVASAEVRSRVWRARLDYPLWRASPNPAHLALAGLERAGRVRALLTQNVDGLHQRAGSSAVELHGSLLATVCVVCGARGSMAAALDRVRSGVADPGCPVCGGVLRAATVSFGEALDADVLRAARVAALDCDVVLVAGTSLSVEPAAGLVELAVKAGALLLVCDVSPTPYDGLAVDVVRGPVGRTLPSLAAVPVVESGPVRTWGDPRTW